MTEIDFYTLVLWLMIIVAPVVFLILFVISAPYGRHQRQGWGPLMPAKYGWFVMEAPASLLPLVVLLFVLLSGTGTITVLMLLLLWQVHYFHRAFIYPFSLQGPKPLPIVVVLMAVVFNTANGYLNSVHFVRNVDWYDADWLFSWHAMLGAVLFGFGFYVTKRSDRILRELRADGESGYRTPRGFLYLWVSSPNYLGECIQWLGWALLTMAPAAWVFLLWTVANLLPRAISHHRWYQATFPEYPKERKALIPYLL